ncbi:hypothetical protein [Mycobacterium ostraviense]|uniref:RsbT co-antagonist protein RsbRD N-terminal domain-containing protein n=1 Tax=Mycobacterium ostraviense TaxID=2738409 RepID=A0A163ZTB3_9MYCO|nr:hypothetical protein [Mycobacterium ostraviense]KZS61811.1 hypothetical protein A4G28_19905 [Mycobacterium ostraviense]UGT90350.1 hypothetical protein LTS72_18650 [Mycobacterium ostraviense]
MEESRLDGDVEVGRYVAEVAGRLHGRLADVSAEIRRSIEGLIPELRADARFNELLGASIEGNVDTMLHALRYDIAVERFEAPATALEYARLLAQHGCPSTALRRVRSSWMPIEVAAGAACPIAPRSMMPAPMLFRKSASSRCSPVTGMARRCCSRNSPAGRLTRRPGP